MIMMAVVLVSEVHTWNVMKNSTGRDMFDRKKNYLSLKCHLSRALSNQHLSTRTRLKWRKINPIQVEKVRIKKSFYLSFTIICWMVLLSFRFFSFLIALHFLCRNFSLSCTCNFSLYFSLVIYCCCVRCDDR